MLRKSGKPDRFWPCPNRIGPILEVSDIPMEVDMFDPGEMAQFLESCSCTEEADFSACPCTKPLHLDAIHSV